MRFFKQLAIVKFKGIDNINDIERYKGCSLYVTERMPIPLEEDGILYRRPAGNADVHRGRRTVRHAPRCDGDRCERRVYIVDSKEHGEVLIPAIHDCILDVDLDEQKMTIHLLPGLID